MISTTVYMRTPTSLMVSVTQTGDLHWLTLQPNDGSSSDLTIFTATADVAETLAKAFEAVGVTRRYAALARDLAGAGHEGRLGGDRASPRGGE